MLYSDIDAGYRCDADEDEEDDEGEDSDDGSGEEDDGDDAATVRLNISRAGLIGCREERVAIRCVSPPPPPLGNYDLLAAAFV